MELSNVTSRLLTFPAWQSFAIFLIELSDVHIDRTFELPDSDPLLQAKIPIRAAIIICLGTAARATTLRLALLRRVALRGDNILYFIYLFQTVMR